MVQFSWFELDVHVSYKSRTSVWKNDYVSVRVESFGHSVAILIWTTPIVSTLGVGGLAVSVRDEPFQVFSGVVAGFHIFFGAGSKAN